MTDETFGPSVRGGEIEQALEATMRKWLATYIRLQERRSGLGETRPLPRSYVVASEVTAWPENQTPAVLLANLGTLRTGRDTPEQATFDPFGDGFASPVGGDYWAEYDIEIAALVVANQDTVRDLASLYGAAVRECVVHKATEQNAIDHVLWVSETPASPAASAQNRRSTASYTEKFTVTARNVLRDNSGPAQPEPFDDPTIPFPDDPAVTDVETDIEPVPLTEEL